MRILRCVLWILLAVCTAFAASEGQVKKRVAVSRFQDAAGYPGSGVGISDMLATALVKTGKFVVLERQELAKILEEQQVGSSGGVSAQTAAAAGNVLGVELLVFGSISEFGSEERALTGDVRAPKLPSGLGTIGGKVQRKTVRAGVDVRLVNAVSGEVIASEHEAGTHTTVGVGVKGEGEERGYNFEDIASWDDTGIGKAAREAVENCVELIVETMEKLPWSGKIIKPYPDGSCLMKPGSDGGVTAGMEFDVYRPGEPILDPDTGEKLGAEETKIARIRVKEDALAGKAAKAIVVKGEPVQTGDIVRQVK
jgi:curli biogenesis system outer membrane secretion channel CsgG